MEYPSGTRSVVKVTFRDTGEVKEYPCSAHPGISRFFADNIAQTGCLCILNGDKTYTIMAELIREYEIEVYSPPKQACAEAQA